MITNSNVPDLKIDSVMKRYLYRDIFCEEYKAGSNTFFEKTIYKNQIWRKNVLYRSIQ